jgi:protein TonB
MSATTVPPTSENGDGRADEIGLKTGSGFARLDEAAMATVRQWRFAPARQGDKPLAARLIVPIVFKPDT